MNVTTHDITNVKLCQRVSKEMKRSSFRTGVQLHDSLCPNSQFWGQGIGDKVHLPEQARRTSSTSDIYHLRYI